MTSGVPPISQTSGGNNAPAYPPNLSAIIEDKTGKYSDAQKIQASQERYAREQAFFKYDISAGDGVQLFQGMIKYYDSLSPEEQQSQRYRGTREAALVGLANVEAIAKNAKTKAPHSSMSLLDWISQVVDKVPAPAKGVVPPKAASVNLTSTGGSTYFFEKPEPEFNVLGSSADRLDGTEK